ncbi:MULTISPECIES: hypothetical protein [Vagococcus]|nr:MULTISPECIES: hypothetical protein [Vagococcus]HCM89396.1 hypothetical protein [Vagococcus sp.]
MRRKVSVVMVSLLIFVAIFYPRTAISESQRNLSFELSKEVTEVQVINDENINSSIIKESNDF